MSLKRKIFNSNNSKSTISFVPSLEYFKTSSGSKTTKSIFNQISDSLDKDKLELKMKIMKPKKKKNSSVKEKEDK